MQIINIKLKLSKFPEIHFNYLHWLDTITTVDWVQKYAQFSSDTKFLFFFINYVLRYTIDILNR